MHLRPLEQHDIPELMRWFTHQTEVLHWAGPDFRFPFTPASFFEDLQPPGVSSWVLEADDEQLLGFGQFSLQAGHCHLSRLIIHPCFRGYGFIQILLTKLLRRGCVELNTHTASLFVFNSNTSALNAYHRAGFVNQKHPQGKLHACCSYLILNEIN